MIHLIKTFILLVFFSLVFNSNSQAVESVYLKQYEIPTVPGAYNVSRAFNETKLIKSVKFFIDKSTKSDEISEFYDDAFSEQGWMKVRNWQEVYNSNNNKFLAASWANRAKKMKATVFVDESLNEESNSKKSVICQISVLFDDSKLKKFYKKLFEDSKISEFAELQKKYKKKGNNFDDFDIEKAISKNKDNAYLVEYKKIIDEIKQQIYSNSTAN